MTCIVAVADKGDVWIGGDSAGSDGWHTSVGADEKVFRNGPFVMGFTTSFRMGQLLRYALDVPAQGASVPDSKYMATTFIDAVRKCLKDGGWAKKDSERESGGTFIIGYRGHVYEAMDDFQVSRPADAEAACGSGYLVAHGALFASRGRRPRERIATALSAAAHCVGSVRPPFHILKLPAERRKK